MMKKRSRLRKRVREWLRKRREWKERKEEETLPSFGTHLKDRHQIQLEKPAGFYQNESPAEE